MIWQYRHITPPGGVMWRYCHIIITPPVTDFTFFLKKGMTNIKVNHVLNLEILILVFGMMSVFFRPPQE